MAFATNDNDNGVEDGHSWQRTVDAGTIQISCRDGRDGAGEGADAACDVRKVLHQSGKSRIFQILCFASTLLLLSLTMGNPVQHWKHSATGRMPLLNGHDDNTNALEQDDYNKENPVIDDCAQSGRCTEEVSTSQIISPTPPPAVPTVHVPRAMAAFGRPNGRPSRLPPGKPSRPGGGGNSNNNRPNNKPGKKPGGNRPNKKPGKKPGKRPGKKPGKRPNKKPGKGKKPKMVIKRKRSHNVNVGEGVFDVEDISL